MKGIWLLLLAWLVAPLALAQSVTVWVDDGTPAGGIVTSDGGDAWNWISSNPVPFSGARAHKSTLATGEHQHYFYNATATLSVAVGDTLFAYVYLDPSNPPSQVMLQWYDGSWEHRAYWGANLIPWGTNGTASRRSMGALPLTGQWVRLDVPASQVGLEGHTLNGMAYTLYGGRATWDYAGVTTTGAPPPPPPDETFVTSGDGSGNVANGSFSAAGGRGSSTGVGATGAFAWGQGATANGGGAIALGRGAVAAYTDTFVVGQGNQAWADNGRAIGWSNLSTGGQGYAHGHQANDRSVIGLEAYASNGSAQAVDGTVIDGETPGLAKAQTARVVLRVQTTDATPTALSSAGGPLPSPHNQLTMPDKSSYAIQWLVVARDKVSGDSRVWKVTALAMRGVGRESVTVAAPVIEHIAYTPGAAGWGVSVAAHVYSEGAVLYGIGAAGRTIQWVAVAITAENVQ